MSTDDTLGLDIHSAADVAEPKIGDGVVLSSPYGKLRRDHITVLNGVRGVVLAPTIGGGFLVDFEESAPGALDRTRADVPAHWLTKLVP
jgi:hypothetical protein